MTINYIESYIVANVAIKIRVGKRIRELRGTKGMTQDELSFLASIPRPNIVKYEKGQRSPSLETLEKIAKALRVDVRELL